MKDQILTNIDNPLQLESLYRHDKPGFRRAFNALAPEIRESGVLRYWDARLNFSKDEISWGSRAELFFVIVAAIVAGFTAKLPAIFGISEDFFYPRNIGFILMPALASYFAWKNRLATGKIIFIIAVSLAAMVYINSLPQVTTSDTLILSCIHLGLVLWALVGFAFTGTAANDAEKRLSYLKYNGDLVVITTLIVIAGGILTGVTIGLFSLIGWKIEEFYFQNVVVFGLPAAPIFGTYLIQTNPQLVGKVSPVIAKIFSPLVLLMLLIYLAAIVYSGKDPYTDRDFLLIFNALLIGVMAIIFFSIAGTGAATKHRLEVQVLFLLSIVTIIVNSVALSAILFRISEWGLTPNRAAVLGGNVLILLNLLLVTYQLYRVTRGQSVLPAVGKAIAAYLPVYCAWVAIVTFLFPLFFGFR